MDELLREENRGKDPMNRFVYDLVVWILAIIMDLFFREVHPRSSWRIPRTGPVLFVAAPHSNQVGSAIHMNKESRISWAHSDEI